MIVLSHSRCLFLLYYVRSQSHVPLIYKAHSMDVDASCRLALFHCWSRGYLAASGFVRLLMIHPYTGGQGGSAFN
jgi:hypothetical protein